MQTAPQFKQGLATIQKVPCITVHSTENMHKLYKGPGTLPKDDDLVARAHFVKVHVTTYAALFGSIKDHFVQFGGEVVHQALKASCDYVSIQKRNYAVKCAKYAYQFFQFSDYGNFDKNGEDWQYVAKEEKRLRETTQFYTGSKQVRWHTEASVIHPICTMTPAVIRGAQAVFGLQGLSTYIVMSDMEESIPQHLVDLPVTTVCDQKGGQLDLILDIYLGMHSALHIRHPHSTLSLPVEITRAILHLPTSSLSKTSKISLFSMGSWFTMADLLEATSSVSSGASQ
jgi:hypothetical protein